MMRYVGNTTFTALQHPSGHGQVAMLICPGDGCGANAVPLSDTDNGPYNGWCAHGHEIHIPYAMPTWEDR